VTRAPERGGAALDVVADVAVRYGRSADFLAQLPGIEAAVQRHGWRLTAAFQMIVGRRGRFVLMWAVDDANALVRGAVGLSADERYLTIESTLRDVILTEDVRMAKAAPFAPPGGLAAAPATRSPLYLLADVRTAYGRGQDFLALMPRVVDALERGGWHLAGAYTSIVGEVGTALDVWQIPSPGAITAGIRAAFADADYRAVVAELQSVIVSESIALAARLPPRGQTSAVGGSSSPTASAPTISVETS
jgi:hypothetical protein